MTLICDFWPHEHMKVSKPSFVQIRFQLFNWGHFHIFSLSYNLTSDNLWPWYMNFDCMNIWRFTYYINKPSLVQIGLQLFKWGHFHILNLSYNLTSDDLWPWYMTFDLINKWGLPCCIYDSTLVEIHRRMWKIEPNVNLFFKTTELQWTKWSLSLCVFPANAGDTKKQQVFVLFKSIFLRFWSLSNARWFYSNTKN